MELVFKKNFFSNTNTLKSIFGDIIASGIRSVPYNKVLLEDLLKICTKIENSNFCRLYLSDTEFSSFTNDFDINSSLVRRAILLQVLVLPSSSSSVSSSAHSVSYLPAPNTVPLSDSNGKIHKDYLHNTVTASPNKFLLTNSYGKLDTSVLPFNVSNISIPNAVPLAGESGKIDTNYLDTTITSAANKILLTNSSGKIDASVLPFSISITAQPNTVPISDTFGKIDTNYLNTTTTPAPNKIVVTNPSGRIERDLLDLYISYNPDSKSIPIANDLGKINTNYLDTTTTSEPNKIVMTNNLGKIDSSLLDLFISQESASYAIPVANNLGKIDTNYLDATTTSDPNKVLLTNSLGKINFDVLPFSVSVSSLPHAVPRADASGKISTDYLDASTTPTSSSLLLTDTNGKISESVLPFTFSYIPFPLAIPKASSTGKIHTDYLETTSTIPSASKVVLTDSTGKINNNLINASTTSAPNAIVQALSTGKIDNSYLSNAITGNPIDITNATTNITLNTNEIALYNVNLTSVNTSTGLIRVNMNNGLYEIWFLPTTEVQAGNNSYYYLFLMPNGVFYANSFYITLTRRAGGATSYTFYNSNYATNPFPTINGFVLCVNPGFFHGYVYVNNSTSVRLRAVTTQFLSYNTENVTSLPHPIEGNVVSTMIQTAPSWNIFGSLIIGAAGSPSGFGNTKLSGTLYIKRLYSV